MEDTDELVSRARSGDADAWAALYRAHAGRLLSWLSYQAPPDGPSGCEDLSAAAWLTAAENIGRYGIPARTGSRSFLHLRTRRWLCPKFKAAPSRSPDTEARAIAARRRRGSLSRNTQ